ncbi:MAG: radical SAM protein [Promethearchaeota archaeon]
MSELRLKGFISEIFSSIQGEGGSVKGSCFGKRQIFIRFSGCNISDGMFNSSGCFWCDSKYAQKLKVENYKYELKAGLKEFMIDGNPVNIKKLVKIVRNLITPDLHSISFTGGEPLYQCNFILELAMALEKEINKYPLYLETNGSISLSDDILNRLSNYFKYCCCDIKDKSSHAASVYEWEKLVKKELNFIQKLLNLGVNIFAKIVVTSKTNVQDIKWISKQLSKIKYNNDEIVGLAIQPVVFESKKLKKQFSISTSHLNKIFYAVSEFIPSESLTLSVQAHKFLNFL